MAIATVTFTENGFRFLVEGKPTDEIDSKYFEYVEYDEDKGWNIGDDGLLIIFLESPHIDEFPTNGDKIAPARGKTGVNLGKYLHLQHLMMPDLSNVAKGRYRVVLMNAIRYQCSLGVKPTKVFRDVVFRDVWRHSGEKNFTDRLKRYVSGVSNHLVINCCTQGNSSLLTKEESAELPDIRDLVQKALLDMTKTEVIASDRLFRRPHPSSAWFFRKLRQLMQAAGNND